MITALQSISLDGVMQAPGRVDEDPRDGFAFGGWAGPYQDQVGADEAAKGMADPKPMLLGRFTYELFQDSWAGRTDNPFSPYMDAATKYVVSSTLTEPTWANTTVLPGLDAVRALDEEVGVLGSGVLVRSLLAADMIDVLRLSFHPLVLGSGTRLFAADGPHLTLTLTEHVVTTTGVAMLTYRRDAS